MSDDILDRLRLKFTSGNGVPVERATITREEFEELEELIEGLQMYIDELGECFDCG